MPYFSPDLKKKIREADRMDLLTYFKLFEPNELVKISDFRYTTKTHDSLIISNGKWAWNSRGIGGYNALQYLMKAMGMSLEEAADKITEADFHYQPIPSEAVKKSMRETEKVLRLPPKNGDTKQITNYLCRRGISRKIINDCVEKGLIYESLPYHNVIFVGYDEHGKARYAGYRAANETRLMGDAYGSDKRYCFRLLGSDEAQVHLFESAVDALSYAALLEQSGRDWKRFNLLSLGGISVPKRRKGSERLPKALAQYLRTHTKTKRIFLHLDNDPPGRRAAKDLFDKLSGSFEVVDNPPPSGKDVNDFLCLKSGIAKIDKYKNEGSYR